MNKNDNEYNEAVSKIKSMTFEDWKAVLDFIPEIENTKEFSTVISKPGYFPFQIEVELIQDFREVAYDIPIVIPFDWTSWREGTEMINNDLFDFDTIDIVEKCKIITTLIRLDRFSEGVFSNAFSSGLMLKILKSIKNQL